MCRMVLVTLQVLALCAVAVAQDDTPWQRPGGFCGQEIAGPNGAILVWVPAGSFRMGSTDEQIGYAVEYLDGDASLLADEQPARTVQMHGFWIGKHEVTNAEYRRFCEEKGREFPSASKEGDDHPVAWLIWDDARAYCEHYGVSLPTEAQWEYAARGPESPIFPWGNEWDGSRLCWDLNLGPGERTFAVGSFPSGASWCGALDMAGNVAEWCADWYQEDYYTHGPANNPPGPDEQQASIVWLFGVEAWQLVTREDKARLLRGSSWVVDMLEEFRASDRYCDYPRFCLGDRGFRVCMAPQ